MEALAKLPEKLLESTHRETTITSLMEGQYSGPVRVVAFNTAEGWSSDVSEDIAGEILERYAKECADIPASLEDFLERHGSRGPVQLPLPLPGAA